MKGNVFIAKYKLKQHTMLLHFHDEADACLRASEVKPKLDRFIVKKHGGKDKFKKTHSSWIQAEHQNGKDVALKYRMTIKLAAGARIIKYGASDSRYQIPRIFYGNMGDGSNNLNKKTGVFFTNRTDEPSLMLTITCFDEELKDYIDHNIAEFFAVTNFGTMQSKGFGSFTVMGEKYKCDIATALKANYDSKKCFKIAVNQSGYENEAQSILFETVKQVYSVMKSGQNIVGRDGRTITNKYIRSYIYVYMHDKGIGNEKAYLKKNGIAPIRTTHDIANAHEHDKQSKLRGFRYVRALFGIGENVEWLDEDPHSHRREKVKIEDLAQEQGIERFASPVFFKIVNGNIYMIANQPDSRIFSRSFSFTNQGYTKGNPYSERKGKSAVISTLTEDEGMRFNITDFLTQYKEYYNKNINKFRPYLRFKIEEA